MVTLHEVVRDVGSRLGFLDAAGEFKPLDSLQKLDLVVEIEAVTNLRVSSAEMLDERFHSVDAFATFLGTLSP